VITELLVGSPRHRVWLAENDHRRYLRCKDGLASRRCHGGFCCQGQIARSGWRDHASVKSTVGGYTKRIRPAKVTVI
jgi:hypothetical protein